MIVNTLETALHNAWPMLAIFLSIIIMVRFTYLITNHKKIVIFKEVITFFFLIYVLMLFEFLTSTETSSSGMNLVPFQEITRYAFGSNLFIYNVIGNIVLFIPFGYFVAYYCNLKKFFPLFMVSTLTSTIVEFVQLKIGRSFDIDDIILNVVGAILGYLLYIVFCSVKKHLPAFFQKDIIYNTICVLLLILFAYLFYHFIGFGWF